MKNSLKELKSKFQLSKERISKLEDTSINYFEEKERKKNLKNEQSLRILWETSSLPIYT